VRFAEILMRDYFMILPKSITKNWPAR
jgi:hypothetical protein